MIETVANDRHRVVWKFPLDAEVTQFNLCEPVVRHIGVDPAGPGTLPCAWIEHTRNPVTGMRGTERMAIIYLTIVGTGHPIPDDTGDFVGTAVTPSGFVWHVYARKWY